MKSCFVRFNWNLFLTLLLLLTGCETTKETTGTPAERKAARTRAKKEKKEVTMVTFFLETAHSGGGVNSVPIFRENPIYVSVEPAPFLDLGSTAEASVVDYIGGFGIQVRFDQHGAFILDSVTAANKGKRIAIFAKFPQPRWLAAPMIMQRNGTGTITFTPDATREEAERIARGLNNAIAQLKHRERF